MEGSLLDSLVGKEKMFDLGRFPKKDALISPSAMEGLVLLKTCHTSLKYGFLPLNGVS